MAKVLIVDDEKANLDALERALGDDNPSWTLVRADGVTRALKVIASGIEKNEPVDVLLTDLVMSSEESGMKLIKEARVHDPLIMSILFTAKEKSLDRYAALEFGAFDVVEKNIRGASSSKEISIKTRAALRYRESSKQIAFLRRYFDPKLYGKIEADPSFLDMKQRTVTIVFWDIRGFSLLCEILRGQPDLIAGFLASYCECATEVIFKHRGVLDKFIGDGVMAIFGLFEEGGGATDNGAMAAINAAQEFRHRFANLHQEWLQKWVKSTPQQIDIGLGCGIHAGDALVGNVGTSNRNQFTALGSTVNFAARIEARAQKDQVLLSQSIEARVRGKVALNQVQPINDIKNIPGVFGLYELAAGGTLFSAEL